MNTWLLLVTLLSTGLLCVFLNAVVVTLHGIPHMKKERGSTATNLNSYSHSNLGLLHTDLESGKTAVLFCCVHLPCILTDVGCHSRGRILTEFNLNVFFFLNITVLSTPISLQQGGTAPALVHSKRNIIVLQLFY
jgi:hypothetical protein